MHFLVRIVWGQILERTLEDYENTFSQKHVKTSVTTRPDIHLGGRMLKNIAWLFFKNTNDLFDLVNTLVDGASIKGNVSIVEILF